MENVFLPKIGVITRHYNDSNLRKCWRVTRMRHQLLSSMQRCPRARARAIIGKERDRRRKKKRVEGKNEKITGAMRATWPLVGDPGRTGQRRRGKGNARPQATFTVRRKRHRTQPARRLCRSLNGRTYISYENSSFPDCGQAEESTTDSQLGIKFVTESLYLTFPLWSDRSVYEIMVYLWYVYEIMV